MSDEGQSAIDAIAERLKEKGIVVDMRQPTDEEIEESLASKENLLQDKLTAKMGTTEEKAALLKKYEDAQAALELRKKEAAEERARRIEEQKQLQKVQEEQRKLERDRKRGEKEKLKAERRQKQQTAEALEQQLSDTLKQYEEALAHQQVVRSDVSRLERRAAEAEEEMVNATAAKNRAQEKLDKATEKALAARKLVAEAKSPALDENISALKEKLETEFYQVKQAWDHINPKKRRRELMNNELRKMVRDKLK